MLVDLPANSFVVWRFYQAPEVFQSLSRHGGDEDWIAIVSKDHPDVQYGDHPQWIQALGVCDVQRTEIGSFVVFIGAHA